MSLIVIEGLDGSGKETQVKMSYKAMAELGLECMRLNFPDYDSESSSLVKMYLNGDFGMEPKLVNPYASCTFYAVDRFASYTVKWKSAFENGAVILSDRYTSSNIVYQMSKLPRNEWDGFISWVEDTEYKKMDLPRPDMVVYLDMPLEVSQELMRKRYSADGGKKDIHERNFKFLTECRECALYAAQKLGWTTVDCTKNGVLRSPEDINKELLSIITPLVEKGQNHK